MPDPNQPGRSKPVSDEMTFYSGTLPPRLVWRHLCERDL